MALFESYERRIDKINKALDSYGISSLEEAKKICDDKGIDVAKIVKDTQPICFENACWALSLIHIQMCIRDREQLVSSDVIGMRFGSLFDATQTMVAPMEDGNTQVQVVSWYDNENSYTSQMVRTIKYFAELK